MHHQAQLRGDAGRRGIGMDATGDQPGQEKCDKAEAGKIAQGHV
jgi:hypothetical protein